MSAASEGRTQLPVSPARPVREEATFFDAVGGEPTFRRLVGTFYAGVANDPLLRRLYPEEDLRPAADRPRRTDRQLGPSLVGRAHPSILPAEPAAPAVARVTLLNPRRSWSLWLAQTEQKW